MKNINRIVFLVLAAISVGLMGYAIYVGASAPESSKIANGMALVQQFDENGEPVNDENGNPIPVASTDEGIEALKTVFATQYKNADSGVLYGEALEEAKTKKAENLTVIPELEAKLAAQKADAEAAQATIAELKDVKYKSGAQKKAYEEAQKVAEEYAKIESELKTRQENEVAWTENIPASEAAIAQAEADGENVAALAKAVSYNILWVYFLMVFAVAFIIFNWLLTSAQNRGNIKSTILYIVLVLAVVGVAYFVAESHGWAEGTVLYDATGLPLGIGNDVATRVVFGAFEYMISDVSILVTYIAFVGAALATIYSAVRGSFKS